MSAPDEQRELPRLAYSVADFQRATGFSRNRVYDAIASGSLRSFLDGRRRFITERAARDFLDACEFGAPRPPQPMSEAAKAKLRARRKGAA